MTNLRAVRYRKLALVEQDNERAQLLRLIADEADRGVLVTAEWLSPFRFEQTDKLLITPIDDKQ